MSRIKYYDDGNMRVSYEIVSDCLYIHVTFDWFNRKVLKKAKEVFYEFKMRAYFDGWTNLFSYTRDERIVQLIDKDAEEIGQDEPSLIGTGLRLYKWDL